MWPWELQNHQACVFFAAGTECALWAAAHKLLSGKKKNHCSARFWFLSNNCLPDRESDKKSVFIFFQQLKADHTSKICRDCPRNCVKSSSITGSPWSGNDSAVNIFSSHLFNVQAVFGWNFQRSHKTHCHEWLLVLQSHYYWDNGTSLRE